MEDKQVKSSTLCVHAGDYIDPVTKGVNTPIFTSTSFGYIDVDQLRYPRAQNTPNHQAVINKLCALEHKAAGLLFGSGMGAISCVFLSLLSKGDHAIIQNDIYGGSHFFISSELERFGIEYTLVDGFTAEEFEAAVQPNSKLIYVETPSNPLLNIVDLEAVGKFAKKHGLTSAIDNTFASPINLIPDDFGIDIVIHSGSKYLSGHSDIIFGAAVSSQSIIDAMFSSSMNFGSTINANTCYLIERSMKTLSLRVERQSANALYIARALQDTGTLLNVRYPGLESSHGHKIAKDQMKGFGAIVTFETPGDPDEFAKRLRIIKPAMSLGGVESTINSPARSSHMKLSHEERQALGITDHLLRVSVGIEDAEDITQDILNALQ